MKPVVRKKLAPMDLPDSLTSNADEFRDSDNFLDPNLVNVIPLSVVGASGVNRRNEYDNKSSRASNDSPSLTQSLSTTERDKASRFTNHAGVPRIVNKSMKWQKNDIKIEHIAPKKSDPKQSSDRKKDKAEFSIDKSSESLTVNVINEPAALSCSSSHTRRVQNRLMQQLGKSQAPGQEEPRRQYNVHNESFFGLDGPDVAAEAVKQSTDPRFGYLYNGFKPPKGVKFSGRKKQFGPRGVKAQKVMEEANAYDRPSFSGASQGPLDGKSLESVIKIRLERFQKQNRPRAEEIEYETVSEAEDDEQMSPMMKAMSDRYEGVVKEPHATSEKRIKKLTEGMKEILQEYGIGNEDRQKYFEEYVGKLIKEKHWKAINPKSAICHAMIASSEPIMSKDSPKKHMEYFCESLNCELSYPSDKFPCFACSKKFTTVVDRYVHEKEDHGCVKMTQFQCNVQNCHQMFNKNPNALRAHFYSNHMCTSDHEECTFGCKTLIPKTHSRSMAEHVYSEHVCQVCNDVLSCSLSEHMTVYHDAQYGKRAVNVKAVPTIPLHATVGPRRDGNKFESNASGPVSRSKNSRSNLYNNDLPVSSTRREPMPERELAYGSARSNHNDDRTLSERNLAFDMDSFLARSRDSVGINNNIEDNIRDLSKENNDLQSDLRVRPEKSKPVPISINLNTSKSLIEDLDGEPISDLEDNTVFESSEDPFFNPYDERTGNEKSDQRQLYPDHHYEHREHDLEKLEGAIENLHRSKRKEQRDEEKRKDERSSKKKNEHGSRGTCGSGSLKTRRRSRSRSSSSRSGNDYDSSSKRSRRISPRNRSKSRRRSGSRDRKPSKSQRRSRSRSRGRARKQKSKSRKRSLSRSSHGKDHSKSRPRSRSPLSKNHEKRSPKRSKTKNGSPVFEKSIGKTQKTLQVDGSYTTRTLNLTKDSFNLVRQVENTKPATSISNLIIERGVLDALQMLKTEKIKECEVKESRPAEVYTCGQQAEDELSGLLDAINFSPISEAASMSPISDTEFVQSKSISEFKLPSASIAEKATWTRCKLCKYSCPLKGGFQCRVCENQFKETKFILLSELLLHVEANHSSVVKVPEKLDCDFCGSSFELVENFDLHLKEKHLCSDKHKQCDEGCIDLLTEKTLEAHLDLVHGFFCSLCQCTIKNLKALHDANVHNSKSIEQTKEMEIKIEANEEPENRRMNEKSNKKSTIAQHLDINPCLLESSCQANNGLRSLVAPGLDKFQTNVGKFSVDNSSFENVELSGRVVPHVIEKCQTSKNTQACAGVNKTQYCDLPRTSVSQAPNLMANITACSVDDLVKNTKLTGNAGEFNGDLTVSRELHASSSRLGAAEDVCMSDATTASLEMEGGILYSADSSYEDYFESVMDLEPPRTSIEQETHQEQAISSPTFFESPQVSMTLGPAQGSQKSSNESGTTSIPEPSKYQSSNEIAGVNVKIEFQPIKTECDQLSDEESDDSYVNSTSDDCEDEASEESKLALEQFQSKHSSSTPIKAEHTIDSFSDINLSTTSSVSSDEEVRLSQIRALGLERNEVKQNRSNTVLSFDRVIAAEIRGLLSSQKVNTEMREPSIECPISVRRIAAEENELGNSINTRTNDVNNPLIGLDKNKPTESDSPTILENNNNAFATKCDRKPEGLVDREIIGKESGKSIGIDKVQQRDESSELPMNTESTEEVAHSDVNLESNVRKSSSAINTGKELEKGKKVSKAWVTLKEITAVAKKRKLAKVNMASLTSPKTNIKKKKIADSKNLLKLKPKEALKQSIRSKMGLPTKELASKVTEKVSTGTAKVIKPAEKVCTQKAKRTCAKSRKVEVVSLLDSEDEHEQEDDEQVVQSIKLKETFNPLKPILTIDNSNIKIALNENLQLTVDDTVTDAEAQINESLKNTLEENNVSTKKLSPDKCFLNSLPKEDENKTISQNASPSPSPQPLKQVSLVEKECDSSLNREPAGFATRLVKAPNRHDGPSMIKKKTIEVVDLIEDDPISIKEENTNDNSVSNSLNTTPLARQRSSADAIATNTNLSPGGKTLLEKYKYLYLSHPGREDFSSRSNFVKLFLVTNRSVFGDKQYIDGAKECVVRSNRDSLIKKGYVHCTKCPLTYHPMPMICKSCSISTVDYKAMEHHMRTIHKAALDTVVGQSIPECPICDKLCPSYEEFFEHKASHYCSEHIECSFGCSELIVGNVNELKEHLNSKHTMSIPNLDDLFLGRLSSDASKRLELLTKSDPRKFLVCIDCGKMAINRNNQKYKCERCLPGKEPRIYVQDEFLLHLQMSHAKKATGDFRCYACPTQEDSYTDDLEGLRNHRYISHGICHRHVRCLEPKCEVLMSADSLKTHLQNDCFYFKPNQIMSEQPYEHLEHQIVKYCSSCSLGLVVSDTYKCKYCDAIFPDEREFYAHMMYDHNLPVTIPQSVNYSCTECPQHLSEESVSGGRWRQHRLKNHQICKMHIMCPNLQCQMLFPNVNEREKHLSGSSDCVDIKCLESMENLGAKQCVDCSQVKTETKIYSCQLCKNHLPKKNRSILVDNMEFMIHLGSKHNKKFYAPFNCRVCNYSFKDSKLFYKHCCDFHSYCKIHQFCEFGARTCSYMFSAMKTRDQKHDCIKSVSEDVLAFTNVEGKLKCEDCDFSISKVSTFACRFEDCSKSFVNAYEEAAHRINDHKILVPTTFFCNECPNNEFRSVANLLVQHYKLKHKRCKFHTVCPLENCDSLYNAEKDISHHLKVCKGKIPTREASNVEVSSKNMKKSIGFANEEQSSNQHTTASREVVAVSDSSNVTIKIAVNNATNLVTGSNRTLAAPVSRLVALKENDQQPGPSKSSLQKSSPKKAENRKQESNWNWGKNNNKNKKNNNKNNKISPGFKAKPKSKVGDSPKRPLKHVQINLGLRNLFKCSSCPKSVWTRDLFRCDSCSPGTSGQSNLFATRDEYNLHLVLTHREHIPGDYSCPVCDWTFPDNGAKLVDHVSDRHSFCMRHFLCAECCLLLPKEEMLNNHQH